MMSARGYISSPVRSMKKQSTPGLPTSGKPSSLIGKLEEDAEEC